MAPVTTTYEGYTITTDKRVMDVAAIHKWLSEKSYWCPNVSFETVKTTFENSFCIGILKDNEQIGFARLVTDYAVMAYLADVYILEEHRNKGLARKMLQLLLDLDWVKELRTIRLSTTDAHGLYEKMGFTGCTRPQQQMELKRKVNY